jgi:hypothetical protein
MVRNDLIGQFVGGVFIELAAPPPRDVRIHHCAAHIVVQGGAVVDLSPGNVGLSQRGLH